MSSLIKTTLLEMFVSRMPLCPLPDFSIHVLIQHFQTYSLVDLFHVPWIRFIQYRLQLPDEIDARKNIKGWWSRVSQRAATKAVHAHTSHD